MTEGNELVPVDVTLDADEAGFVEAARAVSFSAESSSKSCRTKSSTSFMTNSDTFDCSKSI